MKHKLLAISAAGLLAGPTVSEAVPVVYFGENQNPAGTVFGAPLAARTAFLSGLSGVGTEGFESYTPNEPFTNPLAVSFPGSGGGITATLNGGSFGVVDGNYDTEDLGRFNTTAGGSKWWLAADAFSIDFSSPISAFGFYGTDIGDFTGQLTIRLTDLNDSVTDFTVGNTIDGANGSLLFWGFIDSSITYKSILFGNTGGGFDGFGFDDFTIGDIGQIRPVPEPGTLVLLGLGLAGLGFAKRRKLS